MNKPVRFLSKPWEKRKKKKKIEKLNQEIANLQKELQSQTDD